MKTSQFIAVTGGSGSGKSWLAAEMKQWFGEAAVHLCLDDFYRDLSHLPEDERALVNFDDPAAIDWDALHGVLDCLERGEPTSIPVYDFETHTRKPEARPLPGAATVVIEGLWLLHHASLRAKWHLSVFVNCSEEERLKRRMDRDVKHRGRSPESVLLQFQSHVQPMHALFVEPQREWAHQQVNSPMSPAEQAALTAACKNGCAQCEPEDSGHFG